MTQPMMFLRILGLDSTTWSSEFEQREWRMPVVPLRGSPQHGLKRQERFSMSAASMKGGSHGGDSYPAA